MNTHYVYTKLKYNGHKTLILARNVPNWLEKYLLGKKTQIIRYVGHGTRWATMDDKINLTEVHHTVAKKLQAIEAGVIFDYNAQRAKGITINKAIK
jgi:hypothetical protein